ncbi:four-carbon acid sugar kinase family protein [Alicyclobacillus curvatus]|nr:four-carbon acid sugar kinase family protein [Alicyclobacillus curvatus]
MIGVIADDITGANDIGIMFVKRGYRTVVIPIEAALDYAAVNQSEVDVIVIDTDSRLLDRQTAYDRSRYATGILRDMGCSQFFGKVCSVFRGNIGADFDAVLDELGESFAPIVLGFPKNGRTTIHGIHYVRGVKLEDSEFQYDPVHPMQESNLQGILQKQTNRKVHVLYHETLDEAKSTLAVEVSRRQSAGGYLIFDVRNQGDLATIAEVIHGYRVICGSSAIAEAWPVLQGTSGTKRSRFDDVRNSHGVLLLAGSLMPQTVAQIETLRGNGIHCVELDTVSLIADKSAWGEQIQGLLDDVAARLEQDENVLVYAANDKERVKQTLQAGEIHGYSMVQTRQLVSRTLAQLARYIVERSRVRRVVVGGGDTSAAVCAALGVTGVEVLREIAPGLPLSISLGQVPIALVLKSGSFGQPDFFLRAIETSRRL